jgi:hypothetical protein
MRPMAEQPPHSPLFGVPFLLTALFRRPAPDNRLTTALTWPQKPLRSHGLTLYQYLTWEM